MGNRVVIAGGSGFLGRAIAGALHRRGREVVVLSRAAGGSIVPARAMQWDGLNPGPWAQSLEDAEAVINLAGSPVIRRHTNVSRAEMIESRVGSVRAIGRAIAESRRPPRLWVQASATGVYGNRGSEPLDESAAPGTGFLARTCLAWEQAWREELGAATRGVVLRIGVALGRDGGALVPLALLTRRGLGGAAGGGEQYLSWIHIDDLVASVLWALDTASVEGTVNATAPEPVMNTRFMRELRTVLHRPWSPPVPAFVLRMGGRLTGTETSLALEGQRVLPKRLLDSGFRFGHPQLGSALRDLLGR